MAAENLSRSRGGSVITMARRPVLLGSEAWSGRCRTTLEGDGPEINFFLAELESTHFLPEPRLANRLSPLISTGPCPNGRPRAKTYAATPGIRATPPKTCISRTSRYTISVTVEFPQWAKAHFFIAF